jgi:hypothetical protein
MSISDTQPPGNLPVANLGPLTAAGASTWEAIGQLATLVPVDRWAIVGGQMVAIHAALAGVEPPRVTDDGDVVVDVRVFGRQAMRDVASALTSIDFKSSESPEGVTRFERGHAKIDLLAPEGIGANAETIPPGYAIQAPGTTQALDRAVHVFVDWGNGQVTVRCPSLLRAIIAKAASSKEIISITPDERLKHQRDLVFLLSLAANRSVDDLDAMSGEMSKTDNKRLRAATNPIFDDPTHRARLTAPNIDDVVDVASMLLG